MNSYGIGYTNWCPIKLQHACILNVLLEATKPKARIILLAASGQLLDYEMIQPILEQAKLEQTDVVFRRGSCQIRWSNGAIAQGMSAANADRYLGSSCSLVWVHGKSEVDYDPLLASWRPEKMVRS